MTDLEYLKLAEAALARIEQRCDEINEQTDADIDNQRNGAMLTLEFANRNQIVINLQKPLHEIWLAAKIGGFHYKYDGSMWRCTKNNTELFADVGQHASEYVGAALQF